MKSDRLKLQEIFRILIGDSVDEWLSQQGSSSFETDCEWADHLLSTHKQFCCNDKCKLSLCNNFNKKYDDMLMDSPELVYKSDSSGLSIANDKRDDDVIESHVEDHYHRGSIGAVRSIPNSRKNKRKVAKTCRVQKPDSQENPEYSPDIAQYTDFDGSKKVIVEGHEVLVVIPQGVDSDIEDPTQSDVCQESLSHKSSGTSTLPTDNLPSDNRISEFKETLQPTDGIGSNSFLNCTCFLCGDEYSSMKDLTLHLEKHGNSTDNHTTLPPVVDKSGNSVNAAKTSQYRKYHNGNTLRDIKIIDARNISKGYNSDAKQIMSKLPFVTLLDSSAIKANGDDRPKCVNEISTKSRTSNKQSTSSRLIFPCQYCSRTFSSESSLISHSRMHSTDRPFPCQFCHLAFNHRSNLKRHIRTHTGEKPWACSVCNKKFTRASSVYDHMKLHAGSEPKEAVRST